MNIKALRKILENVPEDYLLFVPGEDHSFRLADVIVGSALDEGKRQYTENTFDDPIGGDVVGAVIIL